jgi:hypothetical protein
MAELGFHSSWHLYSLAISSRRRRPSIRIKLARRRSPERKLSEKKKKKMGHDNVWNSHPKNYGPGSRVWYAPVISIHVATVHNSGFSFLASGLETFNSRLVCSDGRLLREFGTVLDVTRR